MGVRRKDLGIMKTFKCDPDGKESIRISLSEKDFADPRPKNSKVSEYLILGFDTEYQSKLLNDTINNDLLSYQWSCQVIRSDGTTSANRSGIVLPEGSDVKDRLSLKEFIEIAITDFRKKEKIKIPRDIYLVAHFTRSDIPGFIDFKDDKLGRDKLNLSNVRNSFVSVRKDVDVQLGKDKDIDVSIKLRDTLHLAPEKAKSLRDLGEILGKSKLDISINDLENMKGLMDRDWEFFKEYGVRDSEICTEYSVQLIQLYFGLTGRFLLPLTLTSIGVDLLVQHWDESSMDPKKLIGTETHTERQWSNRLGRYIRVKDTPYVKKLFWSYDFLRECYHGGRNEQYYFGPQKEDVWYDYDLQSCYPSTMSLIGIPDWEGLKFIDSLQELFSYKPVDLAFANVDFEFPEHVRFPCLPVRTDQGIIFPRKGNTTTHISELYVAKELGCRFTGFNEGRFIPSKRDGRGNRVFQDFLKDCVAKRKEHDKGTLMNLFWKEIANSTYGKLAQGLRKRRVFNLEEDDVKDLEPSKVTNPVFASFVTSFARGVLSEIMNSLPKDKVIFSVTTDGFLTNANEQDIVDSTKGVLSRYYKSARVKIDPNQDETVYEIKHVIRRPLGWRTRGQATLDPGLKKDLPSYLTKDDERVVLAKGGIKTPKDMDKSQQNDRIVKYFFEREPDTQVSMTLGIGIRDMWRGETDFVDKEVKKTLSMEFDWKRKPLNYGELKVRDFDPHLIFDTNPWDSEEQFFQIRSLWEEYNKKSRHVLKTMNDYDQFAEFVENKLSLDTISQKYLRTEDGGIKRLRQSLSIAWRHRKCGTHINKNKSFGLIDIFPKKKLGKKEFAGLLNDYLEIPCTFKDVDNVRNKEFVPNQVPNTEETRNKLMEVKFHLFPELQIDQFLAKESDWNIYTSGKI